MQSDVRTSKHLQREIPGSKGLWTSLLDLRLIAEGMLAQANNIVYDPAGNMRPKDGSEAWWPQVSQRTYLGEMELSENSEWSGGSADSTHVLAGYQARKVAASSTTNMVHTFTGARDLLLGGDQTTGTAFLDLSFWLTTPSDVTAASITLTSSGGTATYDITAKVQALTAATWGAVTTNDLSDVPTSSTGTFDATACTVATITVTCTAGAALWVDELYVGYTDFSKSFCTGGVEFRHIADDSRYTLASFGNTVFADLNEAQAPYKIFSGLTRNAPTAFAIAEDRVAFFDTVGAGWTFTGLNVRPLGFPTPGAWSSPVASTASGGNKTSSTQYWYGMTFIYGEGATPHGQSTMLEIDTPATLGSSDTAVNLQNLPVGALGSGVIARRVWCSLGNAGQYASKFLVGVINDNTTTTFTDTMADAQMVLQEVGPIDNGGPPAKIIQGVWFQKGMLYITPTAVYYSRPGVDLNSSFEIVPGVNIIPLGQSGRLVGGVEFNNQFYLFSRTGVGKLRWQGSVLLYDPVSRAAEDRAMNIGAANARAITVVNNRYLRFMDSMGQVWKMLPNEDFFHESRCVENICDDFNPLQVDYNLAYKYFGDTLAWNTGTYGVSGSGSNVTASDVPGALSYKQASLGSSTWGFNYSALNAATSYAATNAPPGTLAAVTPPSLVNKFSDGWNMSTGAADVAAKTFYAVFTADRLLELTKLEFPAAGNQTLGAQAWTMNIYKPHYETGVTSKGALLSTLSGTLTITGDPTQDILGGALTNALYIPGGESIIVEVVGIKWWQKDGGSFIPQVLLKDVASATMYTPGQTTSALRQIQLSTFPTTGVTNPLQHISGDITGVYTAPAAYICFYAETTELTSNTANVLFSNTPMTVALVQRWFYLNAATNNFGLRSASSFSVGLTLSDGVGNQFSLNPQTVWAGTASAWPVGLPDPIFSQAFTLPQPSDYRPGALGAAGTEWPNVDAQITWNFTPTTPASESAARISLTQADVVPFITNPFATYSTEPSFTNPYAKENYTFDMWTSAPIATGGITNLGALTAIYTVNQQDLFFQVRGASSSGALSGTTWYDVLPGTVPSIGSLAGISYLQIRIIFQDRAGVYVGTPSQVQAMQLGWTATANKLAPAQTPNLFYFKDYTYMSWPGRASKALDHSAALSDHQDDYFASGLWSMFVPPHYGCYFTVGSKLMGGQSSNGRLNRLRNSATTEADGQGVSCSVAYHPMQLGSSYLKTLHWMYFGIQLNVHANGYLQAPAQSWPLSAAGAQLQWLVSGSYLLALSQRGLNPEQGYQNNAMVYAKEHPFTPMQSFLLQAPQARPLSPEYGFDLGMTERSFSPQFVWSAFDDSNSNHYFPVLTGLGFEYFQENVRGV